MVDDIIRRRSWELYQAHTAWALKQVAAGVDGPAPPGSPDPSDYNQHVPDLEASGQAEDEFHEQARRIMGLS
jgi:hypothetical protein